MNYTPTPAEYHAGALKTAIDEHLREVAYWRAQLEAPTGAALDMSPLGMFGRNSSISSKRSVS